MQRTSLLAGRWLLAILATLSLLGCRVLEYRHVQRDFEDAVRADYAHEAFNSGYDYVLRTVTPEYIAQLDARLRPNGWMMRGLAAWRLKEYKTALDCVTRSEKEPTRAPGSRDDVVLSLLPALVIDSEQMDRANGRTNVSFSLTDYEPFHSAYALAAATLRTANGRLAANTPEDVVAYYFYQRWRILQNWTGLITRIDPKDPDAQQTALSKARESLGMEMEQALKQARDKVPASHPLRALIKSQGGG